MIKSNGYAVVGVAFILAIVWSIPAGFWILFLDSANFLNEDELWDFLLHPVNIVITIVLAFFILMIILVLEVSEDKNTSAVALIKAIGSTAVLEVLAEKAYELDLLEREELALKYRLDNPFIDENVYFKEVHFKHQLRVAKAKKEFESVSSLAKSAGVLVFEDKSLYATWKKPKVSVARIIS